MNCPHAPAGMLNCFGKEECNEPCDVVKGQVKLGPIVLDKDLFSLDNQQGVHKGSGKGSGKGKIKTGRPKR